MAVDANEAGALSGDDADKDDDDDVDDGDEEEDEDDDDDDGDDEEGGAVTATCCVERVISSFIASISACPSSISISAPSFNGDARHAKVDVMYMEACSLLTP